MFQQVIRILVVISTLFLVLPSTQAQWNAIAGYDVMKGGTDQFNSLVEALNSKQTNPEKLIKPIRLLHGFLAGIRYSHSFGALELFYRRSLTLRRGKRYVFFREMEIDNKPKVVDFPVGEVDLSYSAAAWSLNFEFGKGLIVGGSIDYNIFTQKVKYDGTGADSFRNFKDKQYAWGNRIFVGIHIANTKDISFSLRPFYQWQWTTTSITALRDQLFSGVEEGCAICDEQPKTLGISLVINNGPQR